MNNFHLKFLGKYQLEENILYGLGKIREILSNIISKMCDIFKRDIEELQLELCKELQREVDSYMNNLWK